MYTKESLELLRHKIDLAEVLSMHLQMQRSGSAYKALCPFHEERTPSFIVQRGDTHYHCFGCGAHGDAIAFLMAHVKMGFSEAVEHLAERFQVVLEKSREPKSEIKGPSKAEIKAALQLSAELYHYLLLHSTDGHQALEYLYKRGLDLDFIKRFQIGYAPRGMDLLQRYLSQRQIDSAIVQAAGLATLGQYGKLRDFFSDRITFPICDAMGAVIGFSARKFSEETFGGKYINTPETAVFKKSRVLFGLSYSRGRITKEKQVIVVEGQVDCLRLIHAGFNYTVAGQGTAFGEEHVKELLQLGVKTVFLALDGDKAGLEAAAKIGNLFQKKGVEAKVLSLPPGSDPDTLLNRQGPEAFNQLLVGAKEYLTFLFEHLSSGKNLASPSEKNSIVSEIAKMIKEWEMPIMVHESLKKLSAISLVPEALLGVGQISLPDLFMKKGSLSQFNQIDPNRILEADLIRWLIFAGPEHPDLIEMVRLNLSQEHFYIPAAAKLMQVALSSLDLMELGSQLETEEEQAFFAEVMQRKVNIAKAKEGLKETIRKILVRQWMEKTESIRVKLQSGGLTDLEAIELAKEFDAVKKCIPQVLCATNT